MIRGFAVLVAVGLTSACLEFEQRLTLRADGSGTQTVRISMTDASLQAAQGRAPGSQEASGRSVDPARLFDAALLRRELTQAGLTDSAVETQHLRSRRRMVAEASFGSLEALRKSPLSGPGAEWRFEKGNEAGTVRLVFFPRGEQAWRTAQRKAERVAREPTEVEQSYFQRAQGEMRDLTVRWTIELPGKVFACSDNLRQSEPQVVAFELLGKDIQTPHDLVAALAPRFVVEFDGSGCAFALDGN